MGRLFVLGALLAASAGPAAAEAEAPPPTAPIRVAVVPGIAVNLDTARVDALSQDLADALAGELEVEAIGGLEVRRMLPPEGVPPDCVTTPTCIADVAQRTGAAQLLFVVMVDSGAGGSIQIDSTWVDPATSGVASRPAIDLTSAADAKTRFSAAARQLLPDAPVRTKPVAPSTSVIVGVTPTMTERVPRHFTTPAKITAGIGVAGLAAGVTFGLITRSKYSTCERDPVACTKPDRDSIRNVGVLADVGFILATGGAIATAVLYMTSGEEPRLIVAPTGDGVAAGLAGSF